MRTAIRRLGNSQGIIIPKPLLAQAGLDDEADLVLEGNALVLRRPRKPARAGWAEASKAIAAAGDDALVMHAFANRDDADLAW